MQDEHFMRQWNDGHENFTADLHAMVNALGRYQRTRLSKPRSIGPAYDRRSVSKRAAALPPAARASLRGLAASLLTFTLWIVVMALATPGPGLASVPASSSAYAGACGLPVELA